MLTRVARKSLGGEARAADLYDALRAGHAAEAIGSITGFFINGQSVASICDSAIQPVMERLGRLWIADQREILTEHRATTICLNGLAMLRQMIGEPGHDAPVALGSSPDGDPYLLPSTMAATVVAEAGYRDLNFGPDLPLPLLAVAAEEHHARLVWLAVKAPRDWARLRSQIKATAQQLEKLNVHFVIGGKGIAIDDLRPLKNIHVMQTMSELAAFARGTLSPQA